MNKINPNEILEAFEITEIVPVQCDWGYNAADGGKCGCALTAFAVSKGLDFDTIMAEADAETVYLYFEDKLSLDVYYTMGFASGFDMAPYTRTEDNIMKDRDEFWEGYADGLEARELVSSKYDIGGYRHEHPIQ